MDWMILACIIGLVLIVIDTYLSVIRRDTYQYKYMNYRLLKLLMYINKEEDINQIKKAISMEFGDITEFYYNYPPIKEWTENDYNWRKEND